MTEKLPNREDDKQSRVAVEKNANVNFEMKGKQDVSQFLKHSPRFT